MLKTQLELAEELLLQIAKTHNNSGFESVEELIAEIQPLLGWVSEARAFYEPESVLNESMNSLLKATKSLTNTLDLLREQTGLANNFN